MEEGVTHNNDPFICVEPIVELVMGTDEEGNDAPQTPRKKKIFPPQENTTGKRTRNPDNWKQVRAKKLREAGESYVSQNGRLNEKKEPKKGTLCTEKCRLNCSARFNSEDRNEIFSGFYKLDVNEKNVVLFSSIEKKAVARMRKGAKTHKTAAYRYYSYVGGSKVQVCKTALCALYQIGRKKVDVILSKMSADSTGPATDMRGRHSNRPHKIPDAVHQKVYDHISRFPTEVSIYYMPDDPHKKYLSSSLNLRKMHQMYLEDCAKTGFSEYNVTLSYYSRIFSTEFNLAFCPKKTTPIKKSNVYKSYAEEIDYNHISSTDEAPARVIPARSVLPPLDSF